MTRERYPVAPLMVAAGRGSAGRLAERVGVTSRTVERWKVLGLAPWTADRAAVAIGLHVLNVWPEWGRTA